MWHLINFLNRRRQQVIPSALLLLIMTFSSAALAADLTARVDRDEIAEDETLTLTVELSGRASGDAPDLSRLETNFEVLGQRQSSQTSFINGSLSRSKTWIYTLAPRRTGTLLIPQLRSGNQTTNSITVSVTKAQAVDTLGGLPNFFVEGDVSSKKVYVQQQIIYTFRVSSAIGMRDAQFSEPLQIENAIIEELDEDRYNKQIQGRLYQVIEQRYAVFPQRSGTLTIPSLQLNATLSSGRQSVFDRGRLVRKKTEPISIEVKPPNSAFTGPVWLPAKTLSINDAWSADPGKLAQGESITRDITLQATGLLASQLPPLPQPKIKGLKIYADQPQIENSKVAANILGQRIESMAMLVNEAGDIALPDIEIPWWNTEKNRMEVATLKGTTLSVAPNPAAAQPTPRTAAPVTTALQTEVTETPVIQTGLPAWVWAVFAALTLAWLVSTAAWLRARGHKSATELNLQASENAESLFKEVQSACKKRDANKLRTALLNWGRLRFGARCVALGDLALRMPSASNQLLALDKAVFGGGAEIDYAELAEKVAQHHANATENSALRALYA